VTFVFTYPSSSDLPSEAFLHDRIAKLQELFPHLYAEIRDGRIWEPYWEVRPSPWAPRDILLEVPIPVAATKDEEDVERVLRAEMQRVRKNDYQVAPQWQLARYLPSEDGRAHLTVSVAHQLADGIGISRLAIALLSPDISFLQPEPSLPPKCEDTLDIRPSATTLVPIVLRKLVLPAFPKFVQNYFTPPAVWPGGQILVKPTQCEEDLSVLSLPAELVASAKTAGAANGVKTLQSTLKIAYFAAMWAVLRPSPEATLLVKGTSPRNERRAELGHSYITGNYIGLIDASVTVSPTTSFWSTASSYATSLSDPAAIAHGRTALGMLAYVPNPSNFNSTDPRRVTGWEDMFLSQAEGDNPFDGSMELSNLGLLQLPPGAVDVAWAQPASPFSSPLVVNVVGHKGGIRLGTTWREGCVVTRAQVRRIEESFVRVVCRLNNSGADVTFGELTRD
jgi:hypothetical protein